MKGSKIINPTSNARANDSKIQGGYDFHMKISITIEIITGPFTRNETQ